VIIEERLPTMSSSPTISPPAAANAPLARGTWQITQESLIGFSIKSLGRTVKGRFGSFSGQLLSGDGDGLLASGSVEIASIDTGIVRRDKHLRSADFFDGANHPQITFASRPITTEGERYEIPGTLTIKGASRDVSLVGKLLAPAPGDDSDTIRIAAETMIDRSDFGVKAPARVELFGLAVAPQVTISLLIVAVREDAGATA
jgi:polyisoprenoid-binding protein YceI